MSKGRRPPCNRADVERISLGSSMTRLRSRPPKPGPDRFHAWAYPVPRLDLAGSTPALLFYPLTANSRAKSAPRLLFYWLAAFLGHRLPERNPALSLQSCPPRNQPRRHQPRPRRPPKASQAKPRKQASEHASKDRYMRHLCQASKQARTQASKQSNAKQAHKAKQSKAKQRNATQSTASKRAGKHRYMCTPRKTRQPKQHSTNLDLHSPTFPPKLCALRLAR